MTYCPRRDTLYLHSTANITGIIGNPAMLAQQSVTLTSLLSEILTEIYNKKAFTRRLVWMIIKINGTMSPTMPVSELLFCFARCNECGFTFFYKLLHLITLSKVLAALYKMDIAVINPVKRYKSKHSR